MVYGFVCRGRLNDSGCELWWWAPQLFNVLLNMWKQLNGEDLTCFRFSRLGYPHHSPPYTNLFRTPSTPDFYSIPHHQLLYIINSTTPPFPTPPPVSLSPSACHPHTLHSGWGGRRTCAADGGVGHFPNQWRERRVVGCIDINSK